MVEVSLTAEEVFRLHPEIRWAALSSNNGEVLFSEMRQGLRSYTSAEEDRSFMELGPLFMTSLAERLSPGEKAGRVDSVVVNLGKDSVLLTKVRDGFLAISVDRVNAIKVFPEVAPMIRERYSGTSGDI